jgi:hypothetical protein
MSNLDINGIYPIVAAEFSSGEWGIESRFLMSLHPYACKLVSE